MSKYCMNCGNLIDDGAVFCDNCGARADGMPSGAPQQSNQPACPYQEPVAPYLRPDVRQPYQQGQPYMQYGVPLPPKKDNKGLVIGLIIAGIVLIAAAVIVLVVLKPWDQGKNNAEDPSSAPTVFETAAPTEAPTTPPTAAVTDAPTDAPTEPPTEAPTQLPYADSIGKPVPGDFTWISDAMSGNLTGTVLGNDALIGKWKGEILYGDIWELVYVTIEPNGKITVDPYQINYGDGWEDESGEEPYLFNGAVESGTANGSGVYGSINLHTFVQNSSKQYGVGIMSINNTLSVDIYLVRP